MEQKDYWNKVADKKEFSTPFQFDIFQSIVSREAKILDVGCGYGRILGQLYNDGYCNLIGVDFSSKMISRGKEQYPYLDLRVKAEKNLEFEDNTFDAVILFAVLTCIVEDAEQVQLLKEIERVLKPGGVIYINDFILNEDQRNLNRYKEFESKYQKYRVFQLPEGAVVRHHDIPWIEQCIKPFDKVVFEKVTYITMNGNKSNGFYFLGSKKS